MNITKLIQQGESETLEFKQSFDKEAIISIGAMANSKGGTVLIGVSDKGEIKGTQVGKETLQQWLNQIGQATEPRLIPNINTHAVKDKTIVEIHTTEYPIKPISVNGRCYLRMNNSNKQLNAKQISDIHLQSLNLSWDTYIAHDRTLKDIDMNIVKRYIKEVNQKGRRTLTGTPLQILHKLELIKENKPTWACCLLFRKSPYGSPYATIRVGRFKGTSTIIDDNVIEGTLLHQADATVKAIMKNINIRYEIKGRIKRKDVWDYPLEAIREAVFNAICHRDYRGTSDIQIKIYDDHMTIWNPGELPYNISIKDLLNNKHISQPRNRLVTQAFYDLGDIERFGSGIDRILRACKEAGVPTPEFEEYQGGFAVTFRKAETKKGDEYISLTEEKSHLTESQQKVIEYIRKHGRITNQEYQTIFNQSKRSASRNLTSLTEKGILIKVGTTGKGTEYRLKDEGGTKRK